MLSTVLGREITYKQISPAEMAALGIKYGMHEEYATRLAAMEERVSKGSEVEFFNASPDRKIVGKHTLKEYLEANKDLWI